MEMLRLLLGSYKHCICRILVRHQEGGEVALILSQNQLVTKSNNAHKRSLDSLDHWSIILILLPIGFSAVPVSNIKFWFRHYWILLLSDSVTCCIQ